MEKQQRTKFYFRFPTRQEWRKFSFKKNDGVLKSLEYIVHTTIIEPCLEEYLKLEQQKITLTEDIGQRLVDILVCSSDEEIIDRIEVDIAKPIVSINKKNNEGEELYSSIEKIVIKILERYELI
ncbi:MAG: hypothetical protein EKK57_11115 [Proteobacteria bacterium]|nr:MAG: hypothetical protein EKK57_11115 [Pseudomonadota bacterium]